MPPERQTSELVRLRAQVHGLVQGVNFRWYTQRRAHDLGLRGFVRNLPDGTVEVVAEGAQGSLDMLLDFLRQGPSAAIVESVETQWDQPTREFSRFEVRY
jgi:acylphosphatase